MLSKGEALVCIEMAGKAWPPLGEGLVKVVSDFPSSGSSEEKERDDQVDEPNYEVKSGARFLQQLDRDYLCSPRLIVRGEYTGQVLKVIAK